MLRIIKASMFKLFRDATFRVTMIIGVALAFFTNFLYWIIMKYAGIDGSSIGTSFLSGETALINALNPTSNFGLTVPINLVVFTVGEFTFGTIRNKIIAGHRKSSIYLSLFVTGLAFTFLLMTFYCLISWGLGSAFGQAIHRKGVDSSMVLFAMLYGILAYIFITALSVFIATQIRTIGGSLPIIIIALIFMGLVPSFINIQASITQGALTDNIAAHVAMWVDPLFMLGLYTSSMLGVLITNTNYSSAEMIAAGIVSPLAWTLLFTLLGVKLFTVRDYK